MIRLFIVAGVRLYREGLADVLRRDSEIEVVATAANGERATELLGEIRPDVALLDLDMPEGRETVRASATTSPETRIVVLVSADREDDVVAWAEAGVAGYVDREASLQELLSTIKSVAQGETPCSPRVAATLFRRIATLAAGRESDELGGPLTPREEEVLRLVSEGLSNKEIATRLTIELPTVKNHVHNILEKLRVERRTEAVAVWRAKVGVPHHLRSA